MGSVCTPRCEVAAQRRLNAATQRISEIEIYLRASRATNMALRTLLEKEKANLYDYVRIITDQLQLMQRYDDKH